jgi:uncharacterized protein (TIGR00255 family)
MTGYGRGECAGEKKIWSIEMRTVNHRFLDIQIRMPRQYNSIEDKIRDLIKGYINRGRVDVFLKEVSEGESSKIVKLDKQLAKDYYINLKELSEHLKISFSPSTVEIAKFPEVMEVEKSEEDLELVWPLLKEAFLKALAEVKQMRVKEGEELALDLLKRIEKVRSLVGEVENMTSQVVEEYKEKLRIRINELAGDYNISEERLAIETAIIADKSNITEEIVRLYSHLKQFQENLHKNDPVGRKLDFLVQEMHREVNTIGSKTNDVSISNFVVDIKSEVEKIKEQVQNIE